MSGTSYSITLSFKHDVIVQTVILIGMGKDYNASNTTMKTVTISCSELLHATWYTLSVQGLATLVTGETVHLAFVVSHAFETDEQPIVSTATEQPLGPVTESIEPSVSATPGKRMYSGFCLNMGTKS